VRPIKDYAVIGDGRSAALVATDGSIDWLCWPRFDSPSLFGALLHEDAAAAGYLRVGPSVQARALRRYLDDSNVLVTRWETPDGALVQSDAMPIETSGLAAEHEILRCIRCERGEVPLAIEYRPRPDYARRDIQLRDAGPLGIRLEQGARLVCLRSTVPLTVRDDGSAGGSVVLRAGDRAWVSLVFASETPAVLRPLGRHCDGALEQTSSWWRLWAKRCRYDGPHRDAVVRSALALKLLTYAPSGAMLAAVTTSLPEKIGADLNWDYRFCWLRDSAFTVRALLGLGYEDEARAFIGWLLHATRLTRPRLRMLYDVYGGNPGDEYVLHHLTGWRGSRPVRVGNAAAEQLQLDAYGELIDAVSRFIEAGYDADRETQHMLCAFGEYVCENWHRPDHGIWETRGPARHHTHSRLLCWTALDRLLSLYGRGRVRKLPAEAFALHRHLLRKEIEERAWNDALGSYTEVLGGETVDASLLLLSWYGFASAASSRVRRTAARVVDRLTAGPGLLYRNEMFRDIGEGAFAACSFWLADLLAAGAGSAAEAERLLERLIGEANDVGLYSEEIGADGALGNFPQSYTHVGLINAAISVEERRRRDLGMSLHVAEARP
jgi:GH15 family glucan-1,4-alpha-glucosidase